MYWAFDFSKLPFPVYMFQTQPMQFLKKALYSQRQLLNLQQVTVAQLLTVYLNKNRPKNAPAIDKFSGFLPYPAVWNIFEEARAITVSKQAAIEFLSTYKDYPSEVEITFTQWMSDIIVAADL